MLGLVLFPQSGSGLSLGCVGMLVLLDQQDQLSSEVYHGLFDLGELTKLTLCLCKTMLQALHTPR